MNIAKSFIGSDRRLKENIDRVGTSESGIPIYEFNYIDDNSRWRGVMSDEIPQEAVIENFIGEFDGVDYNLIDVNFEPCL